MKSIFKTLALMLITAVVTTACEERELQSDPVANTAAINSATLSIIPNESGSVQAFIGDEVSAQGINLENVSSVEFYHSSSSTTAEAEISFLDHTNISFIIPYFDFAQSDQSYAVSLYIYDKNIGDEDGDGEIDPIFSYSYYIAVPIVDVVIDATTPLSPMEATIGDELVITGRNLGQVSAVTFAGITIAQSEFVEHLAESITFAIPEGTYDAGTSEVAVSVTWNGSTQTSVTDAFAMKTPKFDAYAAPAVTPILSDQITLTGENLDIVSGYTWGDYIFSIVGDATSESVTLQIPSIMDIDNSEDVNITKDITAVYGTPEQAVTAATSVVINTTKLVGAVPEVTAVAVVDGGDTEPYKFYLGKEVTLSGSALSLIETVSVGGVQGTMVSQSDDAYVFTINYSTSMTFDQTSSVSVSDVSYTFDTATEMKLSLTYNEGISMDISTIKVYPMYYYKDVCLGLGTTSSSAYTAYGHDNAFFMIQSGEVLSATEWYSQNIDPYAISSSNTITTSNTIAKTNADATMENYYSVKPYLMLNTNSSGKVSLCSASNSNSVLKCHRYTSDYSSYTSVSSTFGTPITYFRNITDSTDDAYMAIMDGTLETINEKNDTSSAVPALAASASSTSTWAVGSVMYFAYSTYTHGTEKPNPAAAGRNIGYVHVKEITCADTSTGLTDATNDDYNAGYVKFDFYVSPERLLTE